MADAEKKVLFSIDAKLDGLAKTLQDGRSMTKDSVSAMSSSFNELGGGIVKLTSLTGVLTGILAGGVFKGIISETTGWIGEVTKLSRVLGTTAQQSSELNVALRTLGIDSDVVTGAALRLAKSIGKDGGEAIKDLGVSITDSNGQLRSSIEIMGDVNGRLGSMHSALERNIAGQKVYGKGWAEAQQTLRLTAAELIAAKERAEQLHLVVGGDGQLQVKEYKRHMNELKLVSTSLAVQIGNELLPELVRLGAQFGNVAVKGVHPFVLLMHDVEAIVRLSGASLDRFGASLATAMSLTVGGKFTQGGRWWQGIAADLEGRAQSQENSLQTLAYSEVGLDSKGNRVSVLNPGGGGDPGTTTSTEKKNYTVDAPGFMNWRRRQEDEKEELDWLTQRNKELEQAQAELAKIEGEMRLDEVENGLMKSDGYLNAIGRMSDSQQAAFDQTSMRSTWAAANQTSDQNAQKAESRFRLQTEGGNSELQRLDEEREAAIRNWAMMTNSFEEYEKRKATIQELYSQKRKQIESQQNKELGALQGAAFQQGIGLINMFAGKSKVAALASLGLQKGLAIGETWVSTKAAEMRAMAELGPIAGPPAATAINTWGMINMGLIAATGLVEGVMGMGGSGGGSGGGSYNTNPSSNVVTQQSAGQTS
ncbi:hypothetical protein GMST_43340 [Geomonas silvestris]|uniref:Bacteriophage tail tape measure C-terminal domain-containing protein n=2 Tax=Geomonas TaxID=2651583 RepID=A0A6V8MR52_9BACT|nr:hypothetical protein [Geomonas silvestris]GFO62009.1 hypothetical protein GMST_43340 [Geomonas silvestris]